MTPLRRQPSARLSAHRPLHFAALAAALLPMALPMALIGCERAVRAPIATTAIDESPEGQLKNVMRRLRFALAKAKPAPESGVVSERKASHRLAPPADDHSPLTAVVTITTTSTLAPAEVERLKRANEGKPEAEAIDAEKIAQEADTTEKKVFHLVFKNEHWELSQPPAEELSETDTLCFQYALSDG